MGVDRPQGEAVDQRRLARAFRAFDRSQSRSRGLYVAFLFVACGLVVYGLASAHSRWPVLVGIALPIVGWPGSELIVSAVWPRRERWLPYFGEWSVLGHAMRRGVEMDAVKRLDAESRQRMIDTIDALRLAEKDARDLARLDEIRRAVVGGWSGVG